MKKPERFTNISRITPQVEKKKFDSHLSSSSIYVNKINAESKATW